MPKITGSAAAAGKNSIASTNAALILRIPTFTVIDTASSLSSLNSFDREKPTMKPRTAIIKLASAMNMYEKDRFSIILSDTLEELIAITKKRIIFDSGLDNGASSLSIFSL